MIKALSWRRSLPRGLTGTVLDVGVGRGETLRYYRHAAHVFAVEPDVERAKAAQKAADNAHVPVTVDVAPAEKLPYDDNTFDHAVSSLVLCSVHDQHAALNEIRRVLKPGGELHLVEHVRPKNELLFNFFRLITPPWRKAFHNCHLDRPTLAALRESGWDVELHERSLMVIHATARPMPDPRYSAKKVGPEEEFYKHAYQGQNG